MTDQKMLVLSIANGVVLDDGLPSSITLDRRSATIGRSASADWVLPDPDHHVSGRHCQIAYRGGTYVLTDISTNGTYLKGDADKLPGEHVIADGDVFEIGHYNVQAALREPTTPVLVPGGGRYHRDKLIDGDRLFETWLATDLKLDRTVVLRAAKTDATDADKLEIAAHFDRWRAFARQPIAGMPAILAIEPDHMVSQWPDASPLRAMLAEGGEAVRPLLDQILREALQTLATLHAHGLVHGNINQDNLRVSIADGTIWLTDMTADAEGPAYPAPELAPGQPIAPSADIFALGKLIEDAAQQAGTAAPAIVKWMVLPKIYRATAADLVEALGLGLRPTRPVPAEAVAVATGWDAPAPPPADAPPADREKKAPRAVSWEEFTAEKKAAADAKAKAEADAKAKPKQEETRLIPDPGGKA